MTLALSVGAILVIATGRLSPTGRRQASLLSAASGGVGEGGDDDGLGYSRRGKTFEGQTAKVSKRKRENTPKTGFFI